MKKMILIIACVASCVVFGQMYCREGGGGGHGGWGGYSGGGGHGGGGHGGYGGGGRSASAYGGGGHSHYNTGRGPSMSRADHGGGGFHVAEGRVSSHIVQPKAGAFVGKNSPSRLQVRHYIDMSKQRGSLGFTGPKPSDFRADFRARYDRGLKASSHLHDRVMHYWPNHERWFTDEFFDHHHWHPHYWGPGCNWWRGARWDWMCGFLPWGWNYPIYYYDNGYPLVLPTPEAPQVTYQDQLQGEAATNGEWMPLGVFALGQDEAQATFSNIFVQLAINKDGDLEGTYYNASLDQTHSIEGEVDGETQQAVWKITDDPQAPIMMTGAYNLTQEMCTLQVRFPDNSEQTWVMVRLKK